MSYFENKYQHIGGKFIGGNRVKMRLFYYFRNSVKNKLHEPSEMKIRCSKTWSHFPWSLWVGIEFCGEDLGGDDP